MYTNDYSPTEYAIHTWRVFLLILSITMSCLLSGCTNSPSNSTISDSTSFEDEATITPTVTVITPSVVTSTPPVDQSSSDEFSAEHALFLLEEYERDPSYHFTLVSDHIVLHKNHYYSFIASKNSIPLEPLILVDKKSGRFSCLSKKGSLLSFSSFPKDTEPEAIDWNGTYTITDINDSLIASLVIDQTNASSFLFYIKSELIDKPFNLSGIAYCNNNIADFINEKGKELSFEYDDQANTIRILDGGITLPAYIKGDEGTGIFQYKDSEKTYQPSLSLKDAKKMVTKLNKEQTGLADEINEYILKEEDEPVVVYDRMCYCINIIKPSGNLEIPIADFYVSIDGKVIFAYMQSFSQPNSIIQLTE